MPKKRNYPCEFCDTESPQQPRRVTLTMERDGRWFIFHNVPAMVCPNCGHRYYDGPMLLRLEKMIEDEPEGAQPVEAWEFSLPDSA